MFHIQVTKDITKEEMSDIHIKAWGSGVKTLYYCRAEGADKADIGTGTEKPLNAVPVRKKIEYSHLLIDKYMVYVLLLVQSHT